MRTYKDKYLKYKKKYLALKYGGVNSGGTFNFIYRSAKNVYNTVTGIAAGAANADNRGYNYVEERKAIDEELPAGYIEPPAGYVEPPAGYIEPPAGYVEPPAGYVEPPAGYVEPPAGYVEPPAGSVEERKALDEEARQRVEEKIKTVTYIWNGDSKDSIKVIKSDSSTVITKNDVMSYLSSDGKTTKYIKIRGFRSIKSGQPISIFYELYRYSESHNKWIWSRPSSSNFFEISITDYSKYSNNRS